jgi:hypothetical protein
MRLPTSRRKARSRLRDSPASLAMVAGHWSLDTAGCSAMNLAGCGWGASFWTVKISSLSKSLQGARLGRAAGDGFGAVSRV